MVPLLCCRLQAILAGAEQSAQARKSKISFFQPEGLRKSVLMGNSDDFPCEADLIPAGSNLLNMDPADLSKCSPSMNQELGMWVYSHSVSVSPAVLMTDVVFRLWVEVVKNNADGPFLTSTSCH